MKIDAVDATVCSGASISVSPHIPHLLSDLHAIRYQRSTHTAVQLLRISWKLAQGRSYFCNGRKCKYIFACTVEPYGTLEAKNALVKPVHCLTEFTTSKLPLRRQISLTLILLTWRIWWAPNNASKWQMGFNSAFKGLSIHHTKKSFKWIIHILMPFWFWL